MAIIKPNTPPNSVEGSEYYPYLATVEIGAEVLKTACVKEVEVVGLSSATAVIISLDDVEYENVPVYIHTDVGCRERSMIEEDAEQAASYFEYAAGLFPMAGGISTSMGTTLTPKALALFDGEGLPLFVFHVLSSALYNFNDSKEHAPRTWRLYALLKIHNGSYSVTEYSLYDIGTDTVPLVPTYIDQDPSTPVIEARRVVFADSLDTVQPFLQRGFQFQTATPIRTAWHNIGCEFDSTSYGEAGETDSPTNYYFYRSNPQYPFSIGSTWVECNLGAIYARREQSLVVDPGYDSPTWVRTGYALHHYNIWSRVYLEYDNDDDPYYQWSHKCYYDDDSVLYFITFRRYENTSVDYKTDPVTYPNSDTVETETVMLFVLEDLENLDQVDDADKFISTTHTVKEARYGANYHYKTTIEQDHYTIEGASYARGNANGCFIWSGAVNITAVTATRTQLLFVRIDLDEELEYTETNVVKCSVTHRTEDWCLVDNMEGLSTFINDVYRDTSNDYEGQGMYIDLSFHLIPHDVRIRELL